MEKTQMIMSCRICENTNQNTVYTAREMLYGDRDEFEYFECAKCGCLQISEIPKNLEKYYPDDYLSFFEIKFSIIDSIKNFIKRNRAHFYINKEKKTGIILAKVFGPPKIPDWIVKANIKLDFEILDVGCGVGRMLMYLRNLGFLHLTGIDPYINKDIIYENGVRIYKKELWELEKKFDFIMLHHSFEHVPNPLEILTLLNQKIRDNCLVLIRIPTVPSFAWRKYKTNWIQLDAPRHLFLHSLESMKLLAQKTGFYIENIEYDSDAFQFWGSEQYINDIPLADERSYRFRRNRKRSIFKKSDIIEFNRRAKELNNKNDGDQACFYLRKI
jgi:2-polyprenyl-3-methyl-5-hydroxy-6-metoxy-1,4-benzoquinol methylase